MLTLVGIVNVEYVLILEGVLEIRQHKFRAWDGKENMIYIKDLYWFEENGFHNQKDQNLWHGGNFKLMQWTGLLDKNGKEIYEGDILCVSETFELLEIRWSDVYSAFVMIEVGSEPEYIVADPLSDWVDVVEVVGNVFEDKHLMDGGK